MPHIPFPNAAHVPLSADAVKSYQVLRFLKTAQQLGEQSPIRMNLSTARNATAHAFNLLQKSPAATIRRSLDVFQQFQFWAKYYRIDLLLCFAFSHCGFCLWRNLFQLSVFLDVDAGGGGTEISAPPPADGSSHPCGHKSGAAAVHKGSRPHAASGGPPKKGTSGPISIVEPLGICVPDSITF